MIRAAPFFDDFTFQTSATTEVFNIVWLNGSSDLGNISIAL